MCGCLSHATYWGPGPATQARALTGNWAGDPLVHWATPARAVATILSPSESPASNLSPEKGKLKPSITLHPEVSVVEMFQFSMEVCLWRGTRHHLQERDAHTHTHTRHASPSKRASPMAFSSCVLHTDLSLMQLLHVPRGGVSLYAPPSHSLLER